MPERTNTYKLEYFKQGSYYSAESDRRRYLTADYNLKSYIGVVGIGIIGGWTIEHVSGLKVQILPGSGVADGYFVESPYVVKQRSDMVPGDQEISVLNENDTPESPLTPLQRATYVAVVQLYNPTFNPVGDIENSYVKVVVPTELTLGDNTDSYIYAERPLGTKPYPLLNDYPPPAGAPPNRANYNTYSTYRVALNVYNAKLAAIHNYQWYTDPDNHFTEVDFIVLGLRRSSSNKIYLGRVITRSGEVTRVDVSGVDNLANFCSGIKKVATELLVEHRHGGSRTFDPPKVRLETDIRDGVLFTYDQDSGRAIYSVTEKTETSIELGHKHTYEIDLDGNGQTIDQTGSTNSHFHKITSEVVGSPEESINFVEDHIHTVQTSEQQGDTWTSSSPYVIYVNGEWFGDETSTNVSVDVDTKKITFENGVSAAYNKYVSTFEVLGNKFTYTNRAVSVYSFMLRMVNYYNLNVFTTDSNDENQINEDQVLKNLDNNPFYFTDSEGNVYGTADLESQSSAAQALLEKPGDQFTFTPNAAKNITITLEEVGSIDEVQIEILGNVEVTGVLKAENIIYLNANKILSGEFIPEVIPFISHIGRMEEQFLPLQYPLVSNDAVRYQAVPSITDVSLGHYHSLIVGQDWDGATSSTMVGNEAVYYQEDNNNNVYFIAHAHGVVDSVVKSAGNNGLLNWQNNVGSVTLTTSAHSHNIIVPVIGNSKVIYAIKEDINGNIYVGTSDGFIIIPNSDAYQFVMNGVDLYFYGNSLWGMLQDARLQYEKETGNPFFLTESVYLPQVTSAEDILVNVGDSVLLTNTIEPDREGDEVMIKKISYFKMPNFKYVQEKNEFEVISTEKIVDGPNSEGTVIVERDFNNVPIWSIEIQTDIADGASYVSTTIETDLLVVGSDLVSKSTGIEQTPYQPWEFISLPFSVGVLRKIIRVSDGSYWVATNGGVLVSRNYANGDSLMTTNLPGGNPDIKDILEGEMGTIYIASPSGIFTTTDGGKIWNSKFEVINGFKQISRDFTLDKSTIVNGHYHDVDVDIEGNGFLSESIGTGVSHVHKVTSWDIALTLGHIHTLVVTLYAVDNNKIIWRSIDNGTNWTNYGELPEGENGNIFPAFGKIFVSQEDGLYSSSNGHDWSRVLLTKAYSYEWSYDMGSFFVGADNVLYVTYDGITYVTFYTFSGYPSPILLENGTKKNFGYAYSNRSRIFNFKDLIIPSGELTSLIDFGEWIAQEGSWGEQDQYDVYINYKRILSTKYDEDKRTQTGYNFNVIPSDGVIDFSGETTLAEPVGIFDDTITVMSVDNFIVGNKIAVGPDNRSTYASITAINGKALTIDTRFSEAYDKSAKVVKIPALNGDSSIIVNIYNSLLSNIGNFTHYDLEDGLSIFSDGRPYQFNDSYLSNLLQLTQAARYVYPSINSDFINNLFYDFRYSLSQVDPVYPYIRDYIDVLTSDIYNQQFYNSSFLRKGAKSINRILVGYGVFDGTIIVATDIGIFWAKLVPSLEANWFYINDLPYTVNDISIFGGTRLLAATSNGTYYTEDMITWIRESTLAMDYASYALGLRWIDSAVVTVPAHSANFISNLTTGKGKIIATAGTPYKVLEVNQGIKITGDGDKNGTYIIEEIKDGGTGFGSELTVSPSFNGPDGVKTGVIITMGTWWGQWSGDENTSNVNITNTLLVGGENSISYNNGGDTWSWQQAETEATDFIARYFLPLSNGKVLAAAQGNAPSNQKNYLFDSNNIGQNWDIFRSLEEVRGNILSSEISDFNNTVIKVKYIQPENYIYVFGILDQQEISIYQPNSTVALFNGYVVWNEKRDGFDKIVIFGNEAHSVIGDNTDYIFRVFPSKINTMTETGDETIFFGTDKGIYYDVNTVVGNLRPEGTIVSAGINGGVEGIDISGRIISLRTDSVTNNTVLSVTTNTPIRGDELAGKKLYITDADPVEIFEISESKSIKVGGESTIEIKVSSPLTSKYVQKRFRIVGDKSRLSVNFDLPVLDNQFNGGTLYITSDEYGNRGESYKIVKNGSNFIDLDVALIPSSTLVTRKAVDLLVSEVSETTTDTPLQEGQSIRLVDSTGYITLWITLDRQVKENTLKDLIFELVTLDGTEREGTSRFTIESNLDNAITLQTQLADVIIFDDGDRFVINGALFEQLPGFSLLKTSIDSDHFHDVNTVGGFVSGKIDSFTSADASFVTFTVSDTINFNNPIVQLPYSGGDLFKDAQIVFTTDNNINMRYLSDVVSHTATTITVRLKSSSYWSLTAADNVKISEGWDWNIDATNYGYTDGITYDDFVVISRGITADGNRGSDEIKVESTSGIVVGDKLRLQDDTLSFEINYVSQIVDAVTIKFSSNLSRTFFLSQNPQIKVLRDTFGNTHLHQIRANQVDTINIEAYLDNGYPSAHSHRVLPLIPDVAVLLNYNNSVLSFGSGSIIYKTIDNGVTWGQVVDLNSFVEGGYEVEGISAAVFNQENLITGATNGSLFAEVGKKAQAVKLEDPL